jgi:hypothetical protein
MEDSVNIAPRSALLLCLLLLAPLAACGDAAGPGGGPIIVISQTWRNATLAQHTIFFRSPDDGQPSGVIAGREDHPTFGPNSPVGGFWADGRVEIVIHRGEDRRHKYVAYVTADNPERLEFTPLNGGPAFVLLLGLE